MTLKSAIIRTCTVCALATCFMYIVAPPVAAKDDVVARFTATAISNAYPGPTGITPVDIVINRWSTEAERERLFTTLLERGPEKMLDVLRDLPRVGFIRTPNSLGYDLHYAGRTVTPDGAERIVIATDRPIGFWEAVNRPRTFDYPFTLIELHIGPDGKGEGKLSLATKITLDRDDRTIELENYSSQPVMLKDVRREAE